MLSLKEVLKDIVEAIINLGNTLSGKQSKTWEYVGETTGTLSYNANDYNELVLIIGFGGVYIPVLIPVVSLYSSADKTHFVGYYGNPIYVNVSRTKIAMSKQPAGYTATMCLYGR